MASFNESGLRGLSDHASINHVSHDDMIALQAQPDPTRDAGVVNASPADALNLVTLTSTAHNPSDQITDPDSIWDGERISLANFLESLELVISKDSELYSFAVNFFVALANGKTAVLHPGQAAQLDGVLPLPSYDWSNPAPEDPAAYAVSRAAVIASYNDAHARRLLLDPSLDPTRPTVPGTATYLVDIQAYVNGTSLFHGLRTRLRNLILSRVSNAATRKELSRRFTDGRALLAHLRAQASVPLSTSEVSVILRDIETHARNGLTSDTTLEFKRWEAAYHRLHDRIPTGNASRDTDAMRAMRYLQAVVRNRPAFGRDVTTHMRAASVDQNDPAAVRASIIVFLEDTASVARLCVPSRVPAASIAPTPPAAPVDSIRALTEKVDHLQATLHSLMSISAPAANINAVSLASVSKALAELGGTP